MATTTLTITAEGGWVEITASAPGGEPITVDGRSIPAALRTLADVIERRMDVAQHRPG